MPCDGSLSQRSDGWPGHGEDNGQFFFFTLRFGMEPRMKGVRLELVFWRLRQKIRDKEPEVVQGEISRTTVVCSGSGRSF
jgi:hypothetical protein